MSDIYKRSAQGTKTLLVQCIIEVIDIAREGRPVSISSISSTTYQFAAGEDTVANMKQSVQQLGIALKSGSLSDAKITLAQLQKFASIQASEGKNPLTTQMDKLTMAIASGDLQVAKAAYAEIMKTIEKQPVKATAASLIISVSKAATDNSPRGNGSKSSNSGIPISIKSYDKRDTNKDGRVSTLEEQTNTLKHPDAENQTTTTAITGSADKLVDLNA